MMAVDFPDANQIRKAGSYANCSDLYVQSDGEQMLSCWRMTFRERWRALRHGTVWLCVGGQGHPPVWLTCAKDIHDSS